jgi:hypothetical protein
MKQKLFFTAQVFVTLIMFVAVFISYLEDKSKLPAPAEKPEVKSGLTNSSSPLSFNPFTYILTDIPEGE